MRYCHLLIALIVVGLPLLGQDMLTPNGFVDLRYGLRTQDDPLQPDSPLGEARLQLDWNHLGDLIEYQLTLDLVYDDVARDRDVDLEEGKGWLDPREAWMLFSPTGWMDVKLGRQILTWGTGDQVFINDLFPKDWQSFFSGRDVAYLKAPSDALLMSFFPTWGNLDVVVTPNFDADRFISGARFSYYSPFAGGAAGRDQVVDPIRPTDPEVALRFYKTIRGFETALYGYDGFWKSPMGIDGTLGRARFPELRTYGASIRGPIGKGLFHGEVGIYDSREALDGSNPQIPNDEHRLLLGYEQEIADETTLTVQYYLEQLQDYAAYEQGLPPEARTRQEHRDVWTLRLTRMAYSQKLTLSLFVYHGAADKDGYTQNSARYKLTDNWLLTAGGNLFWGSKDVTFFGQFEDASNLYGGARYSF